MNTIKTAMLKCFLIAFTSTLLSPMALASYYDTDQDLTYALATETSGSNWRNANYNDVNNLFSLNPGDDMFGDFNQEYVDIIISLGGTASEDFSSGSLSCDQIPGTTCEDQVQICATNPSFPFCSSISNNGSGSVSLYGFWIDGDDSDNYLYQQELWFVYSFDELNDHWMLEITGYAAELGDYCYEEYADCDIPPLMVSTTVPVPAATWLFASALIGLTGIKRKTLH